MKTFTTLAMAAALTASFAGATFAQGMMSDADKQMMTRCKGMSETAMKADKDCMAMMKKNPDAMNTGASDKNKTVPTNTK
jgi:hypothetical protein